MRRDTLAFLLAGTVFGIVVGYMAASWDVVPRPVTAGALAPAEAAAPARAAGLAAPAGPGAIDPDEVRAMEGLAARAPQDAGVRVELGNLYMDHQRWDEAIRWYREALAIDASSADVRVDLGASLVSSGRAQEGLAEFDAVLKQSPGHRNALFNRGVALLQLGRAPEAADVWEDLLKRHPDDPQLARLRPRIEQIRAGAASGR
jgi:tetratricopeptide (TPR) repeat protein